jgi:hypothetical protein
VTIRAHGVKQRQLRVSSEEVERVRAEHPTIPRDVDVQLIFFALDESEPHRDTRLAQETLHAVRDGFWDAVATGT